MTQATLTVVPNGPVSRLTKREHFAALAMQGILPQATSAGHAASIAVDAADALIEALNKKEATNA